MRDAALPMTNAAFAAGLFACAVYLVVAVAAALAARAAGRAFPGHPDARAWAWTAAFFVLLCVIRLTNAEHALTDLLREQLRLENEYEVRQEFQRPIVALVVLLVAGALVVAGRRLMRRRHRLAQLRYLAHLGVLALIVLSVLRLVSFHAIDSVLYGTLHLNWVVDLGASAAVGICAALYARRAQRRARD